MEKGKNLGELVGPRDPGEHPPESSLDGSFPNFREGAEILLEQYWSFNAHQNKRFGRCH